VILMRVGIFIVAFTGCLLYACQYQPVKRN
jgi:hypothetical protein